MVQVKVTVDESQVEFLKKYREYGFRNKSSMVRSALNRLKEEYENRALEESAELYAEIYEQDDELEELTESASTTDWPE